MVGEMKRKDRRKRMQNGRKDARNKKSLKLGMKQIKKEEKKE